jgi:hypothetical protein
MVCARNYIDDMYLANIAVLKHNAPRIWDVGEMEYRLIAFMVNELPMKQLTEIEANSPVRTGDLVRR